MPNKRFHDRMRVSAEESLDLLLLHPGSKVTCLYEDTIISVILTVGGAVNTPLLAPVSCKSGAELPGMVPCYAFQPRRRSGHARSASSSRSRLDFGTRGRIFPSNISVVMPPASNLSSLPRLGKTASGQAALQGGRKPLIQRFGKKKATLLWEKDFLS